jgi:hypothetical protein
MATASKSVSVELKKFKEHKKVIQFRTSDESAPVGSAYVSKEAVESLGDPDSIKLTVSAA